VSRQSATPSANLGGWCGSLQYQEMLTGSTANYVVCQMPRLTMVSPGRNGTSCSSSQSSQGRSGYYQDQVVDGIISTRSSPHDGEVNVMNAIDPTPASPTVATADLRWATTLVHPC
jgi:hypothetical protein